MNPHYQAFLNFIHSKGATQSDFEAELTAYGTPVEAFIDNKLNENKLQTRYMDLWGGDENFFSFAASLKGLNFWYSVFAHSRDCTTADVLAPFYATPLTNEQVFSTFLHYFAAFDSYQRVDKISYYPEVDKAIEVSHPWLQCDSAWTHLDKHWKLTVDKFNLTGTIDLHTLE